jgi:hypothetical protein
VTVQAVERQHGEILLCCRCPVALRVDGEREGVGLQVPLLTPFTFTTATPPNHFKRDQSKQSSRDEHSSTLKGNQPIESNAL